MSRKRGLRRYQKEARSYLTLFFVAVLLLNLPTGCNSTLQSCAFTTTAPLGWVSRQFYGTIQHTVVAPIASIIPSNRKQNIRNHEKVQQLEAQNNQLQSQINQLLELVQEQTTDTSSFSLAPPPVSARVILRPPEEWLSTFWIDLGEHDNTRLGYRVVSANSPVVVGKRLIGVVDKVEKHKSRVRLITDSGVTAAVRVARGQPQNLELLDHLDHLIDALHFRDDLVAVSESEELTDQLEYLHDKISPDTQAWRLAKGELQGSGHRTRSGRPLLHGRGFNCDWEDDHTPARDLRSGKPREGEGDTMSLIQRGDLLITSGLDGLFPPDLHLATVTRIYPLKEGASSYDLEAIPCCPDLDQLQLVSILPAIEQRL